MEGEGGGNVHLGNRRLQRQTESMKFSLAEDENGLPFKLCGGIIDEISLSPYHISLKNQGIQSSNPMH